MGPGSSTRHPFGEAYEYRVESLLDLIGRYDREITELDGRIHLVLRDDAGYRAIQQLSGVGRVFAGVFVAEIGDIGRFPNSKRLFLGGVDPASSRVRRRGVLRVDHQTRIVPDPVGGGRGGGPAAGRGSHPGQLPTDRRPPRYQHRPGRRRPQTGHLGVLRDT